MADGPVAYDPGVHVDAAGLDEGAFCGLGVYQSIILFSNGREFPQADVISSPHTLPIQIE